MIPPFPLLLTFLLLTLHIATDAEGLSETLALLPHITTALLTKKVTTEPWEVLSPATAWLCHHCQLWAPGDGDPHQDLSVGLLLGSAGHCNQGSSVMVTCTAFAHSATSQDIRHAVG